MKAYFGTLRVASTQRGSWEGHALIRASFHHLDRRSLVTGAVFRITSRLAS